MDSPQIILIILIVMSFFFVAYWSIAWWRLNRAMRMSISMTEGRGIKPEGIIDRKNVPARESKLVV